MHNYNTEQVKTILVTLREQRGSYERAASKLGISERDVMAVDIKENKAFGYTPEGKGREELKPYLIATRNIVDTTGWDNSDPKIKFACEKYDQGEVEMATGRDGFNLLLYAFPRREKDENRKPWFADRKPAEVEGAQA